MREPGRHLGQPVTAFRRSCKLAVGALGALLVLASDAVAWAAPPSHRPYAPPPPYSYYPPPPYVPPEPPRWKPGEPAPPGYRVVTDPDWKTITSAGALFIGCWSISAMTGGALNAAEEVDSNGRKVRNWTVLYYPAAGPFLAMRYATFPKDGWVILLLDGSFQTMGLIAGTLGFFTGGREHLARDDEAWVSPRIRRPPLVAPTFGPNRWGLQLAGDF
jgi:hypothetical protein